MASKNFEYPQSGGFRESLKKVMTWKELKAPMAVTFACAFGMAIALVDRSIFNFDSPFDLKASSVLSAILLVMDMGSAEKFYVSTSYRMIGTLAGMCVGLLLALAEGAIISGYKDHRKWHQEDWKIIVYRTSVLVPLIFASTLVMKRWSKIAYPVVVFAVQTPSVLFKKDMADAVSSIVSTVVALSFAALSIVVFDNMSTESIISESNYKAVEGVLSVMELSMKADHAKSDEFRKYSEQVHKFISQAESAAATYSDWRKVTCRKLDKDYSGLTKPLKALFYQAYSLFWSHAESFKATEYDAAILFCESDEIYRRFFKESVEEVIAAIRETRERFDKFLIRKYHTSEETFATFLGIVDGLLWDRLYVAQDQIRATYLDKRMECFPTFAQRWNMTHYMRQLCLMSLALLEYVKALAEIFLEDVDKQAVLFRHIEELADALDEMRKNELVFLRIRTTSKTTNSSEGGGSPAASFIEPSPTSTALPMIEERPPETILPPRTPSPPVEAPPASPTLQRRLSDPLAGEKTALLARSQTKGGL